MTETGTKRSLTDSDIATYQRRAGPQGGAPGTDVDTDAHAPTDADATPAPAPAAQTDRDATARSDRDA